MKSLNLMSVVFVLAAGSVACGQSVNIDFGTGPVAAEGYGGAGLAGVWNGLTPSPGVPASLVGLNGEAVAASVVIEPELEPALIDDPATSRGDEDLLDDLLLGQGDVVVPVSFAGLQKGTYEVITYGWFPGSPGQETTIYIGGPGGDWNGQTLGGPWPGELTLGVTHALHIAEVTDGTLQVNVLGSIIGSTGALNGIQLRHMSYMPEDVNQDGAVDTDDLVMVIMNWTTPGHGCDGVTACAGDVNGDQVVDVLDLIAVIAAWSP